MKLLVVEVRRQYVAKNKEYSVKMALKKEYKPFKITKKIGQGAFQLKLL